MTSTSATPSDKVTDLTELPQVDQRPLSAAVRRGALWSLATTILLKVFGILVTAVVAHILDPHDFGVFAVALTTYQIVSTIGELGVSACLLRADLDIDSLAPTMATVAVATSAIQAAAMIAFAKPIAEALGSAQAAEPIRVMALVVIIVGVFTVPSTQLIRNFKQDKLFLAELISFVPSTVVLLLLAKSGSGAIAFAWSQVVGQFVSGCVVFASVPKHYRPGITLSALSPLLRFGLPLATANIVNYILLNVDYALVGHLLGPVELGIYVLAFNVASWPSSILWFMISNVSMPAFSRVKHDADLVKSATASALRALSLIAMPISALTMALARPIVLTLYGAKWAASADVLTILSLYGSISIMCLLFANILAGLGRAKFVLVIQLIWLGTLVPIMALGVHQHGILGAAVAHITVIGPVVLPSYLVAMKKTTGIRYALLGRAILPALIAALAAGLVAKGTALLLTSPLVQLITGLTAGGLTYVVVAAPKALALLNREQAMKLRASGLFRPYKLAAAVLATRSAQPQASALRKPGRRRLVTAGLAASALAVGAIGTLAITAPRHITGSPAASASPQRQEAAARDQAATWIAHQVSRDAIVSCDPVMCVALAADGFPSRNLDALGPTAPYPVTSAVVVVTAAVRNWFGTSLSSAWAPAVIATFGSGNAQITVRVISPRGAAVYQTTLSADLIARQESGSALLHADGISVSTIAEKQLISGQVDSRLLLAIADLAAYRPIDIVQFGNIGPGAGANIPLRFADLAENDQAAHMDSSAYVRSMLAHLEALDVPFRPASAETVVLPGGQTVLRIEFSAPSPLGLLGPAGSP
jgi:lipopolysaccharide exporter